MESRQEKKLKYKTPYNLIEFADKKALTGAQMKKFLDHYGLKLTESGHALGINTSALYGKKKAQEPLHPSVSLLLRLYTQFDHMLPRIKPPSTDELIDIIQAAEPGLPRYAIGPLLGLEPTSGHRLNTNGLDTAAQSTRILAWLIHTLLKQSLKNWDTIKSALIVEAMARNTPNPENVLREGGWNKNPPNLPSQRASNASDTDSNEPAKAGLIRRKVTRKKTAAPEG